MDLDIVIKNPVFDYDCCLQRWKYRFEMSLFNFTTGLLTGNGVAFLTSNAFRKFLPQKFPGLYGGIYLAQNYKVPVVPDPQNIYQKAVSWLETLKKDTGKED